MMPQTQSVSRLHPFARMALGVLSISIAVYGVSRLFDNSVNWMNPEYLVIGLPGALTTGLKVQWQDFLRGFEPLTFDVLRPRFINYVITILNVKFRLAVYEYFIPMANLSLGLILHLVFAPLLFFAVARRLLADRWMALLCTCLYVTSVGFLSSVVLIAQPGKALIHILTLTLFFGLAILDDQGKPALFMTRRRGVAAAVMLLNLLGLAVDDQYPIVALVGVVLYHRLFWPMSFSARDLWRAVLANACYFVPFVLFFLFVAVVAPEITERLGNGRCDYIGFALNYAKTQSALNPYWPFLWNFWSTVLAASFGLIPFPSDMSPFDLHSTWPQLAVLLLWLVAVVALLFKQARTASAAAAENTKLSLRVLAATGSYIVLQAFYQRLSGQVTGGYYYTSLSAIFVSLFVGTLLKIKPDVPGARYIPYLLPMFMIFQVSSFLDLNERWRSTHIEFTRLTLEGRKIFPNFVVNESGPRPAAQTARMNDLWNRWRKGEPIGGSLQDNWPMTDGWFLLELNALAGNVYVDKKDKCTTWDKVHAP